MNRYQSKLLPLACLLFGLSLWLPGEVVAQVKLQAGTELTIAFRQDVSSKFVAPGDEVPIKLVGKLEVGGVTLVKDGAPGRAVVKSVEAAGKGGKPGRLVIELSGLDAEGGGYQAHENKVITLEGLEGDIIAEGKAKKLMSYIFIAGLFIKGGEAIIPADRAVRAKVTEDLFVFPIDN